jgi:UDP-N-acetylmuramoyl-L-alanyl-D-glutamate--2,6-diaminopimelate ligase
MGAAAARLSSLVVVTSDNPRREDPDAIIADVLAGIPETADAEVVVLSDREEAIAHALAAAGRGDVVVIAGKGAERYQKVRGRRIPFDDREVARRLLKERHA